MHRHCQIFVGDPLFQSAPLTDVRGDPRIDAGVACPYRFQSAPLTDVRGDVGGIRLSSVSNSSFNPLPSRM